MIDAAVMAVFLAACLWLGARARREEELEGWLLAGRTMTLPLFVASLVPTFYGGVLGVGEFAWASGLSNWLVMGFPYYVVAALYALLLAQRVRLTPGMTIPDHLESAYGRPAALLGALLVFVLASPADELLMAGTLLGHLTGAPPAAAAAAAAALAAALIWNGGLSSDASANRLQFVVMFLGFGIVLPFAWRSVGSPAELAARLPAGHLTLTGGLGLGKLLGWWLIAVWTVVDPAFHQRCAAARDHRVARRGILVSIGFWALFDLMTTTAGLYARAALPDLDSPLLAFPRLADAVLPAGARGLFFAGVAASLFAALQGTALLAAASLGKDGLARLLRSGEESQRRWTRGAVVATLAFAYLLGRAVPSVVGLWYAVGSAAIPGLLLPMLGVYAPRWRVPGQWALASSLLGSAASLAWLAASRLGGGAPWGLEPMLPGLLGSAAVWAAGLRVSSRREPRA